MFLNNLNDKYLPIRYSYPCKITISRQFFLFLDALNKAKGLIYNDFKKNAMTSSAITTFQWKSAIKAGLLDLSALAFIYFLPALSHMLSIKLYLIEPMRLMLILALVHTNRKNAYLLALTLPFFSYLISAHPVFIKSALIAAELVVNVALFHFLVRHVHRLGAIFASIWLSKIFYYGLKYLAILTVLPNESLIGTPLQIQLATSAAFSLYLFLMLKKK